MFVAANRGDAVVVETNTLVEGMSSHRYAAAWMP
jgi:hypothetical protein